MTTDKEKFDPKAKWMLMYATNVSVPPNHPESKPDVKQFHSRFDLFKFLLLDKVGRAALTAGRIRIFEITDKKTSDIKPPADHS